MPLSLDSQQRVQRAFLGGQSKESLMARWNLTAVELEDILSALGRNKSPKPKPTVARQVQQAQEGQEDQKQNKLEEKATKVPIGAGASSKPLVK
jgi:hypothetical protein